MADELTEREIIAQTAQEEVRKVLQKDHPELFAKDESEPDPLVLNINGNELKFKDKAQLEAALSQTFQTFNKEIADRDARIGSAGQHREGSAVTGKESDSGFSQEEYIALMGKDILKANDYLLNHQIFGGRVVGSASVALRQKLGEIEKTNATLAAYQFKESHPEFPMNAEATNIIEGIRRELGQPFTPAGLEASYGVAQSRNLLPSPQVAAYQKQARADGLLRDQEEKGDTPLGFQPPPRVSRTGAAPIMDLASQVENLSFAELQAAYRKAGLL